MGCPLKLSRVEPGKYQLTCMGDLLRKPGCCWKSNMTDISGASRGRSPCALCGS